MSSAIDRCPADRATTGFTGKCLDCGWESRVTGIRSLAEGYVDVHDCRDYVAPTRPETPETVVAESAETVVTGVVDTSMEVNGHSGVMYRSDALVAYQPACRSCQWEGETRGTILAALGEWREHAAGPVNVVPTRQKRKFRLEVE